MPGTVTRAEKRDANKAAHKLAHIVPPASPPIVEPAPTRAGARERNRGDKGPLAPREEARAAVAMDMFRAGRSYTEIARAVGASNSNVIKRYIRAIGKRLRESNEDALSEFLAREDARDLQIMTELLAVFLDEKTDPSDKAKLSDSINKVREAAVRRREKTGVLPREPDAEVFAPRSLVAAHGFDKVQRLALAMLDFRDRIPETRLLKEAEET